MGYQAPFKLATEMCCLPPVPSVPNLPLTQGQSAEVEQGNTAFGRSTVSKAEKGDSCLSLYPLPSLLLLVAFHRLS